MDVLGDRPAGWSDELELEGLAVGVRGSLDKRHPLSGKGVLYGLTPMCHHVPPRPVPLFLSSRYPVYKMTVPGGRTANVTKSAGRRTHFQGTLTTTRGRCWESCCRYRLRVGRGPLGKHNPRP